MATIGELRHVVTFQSPSSVPDGDGGVIDTWTDVGPPWAADVRPATIRDLERQAAGTVVAAATHIVTGRYRPDVAIDARMTFGGRTFRITGVKNVDERSIVLQLFAVETI